MNKRMMGLTLLLWLSGHVFAQNPQRPNILFIIADDMGWTALRSYGNQAVATQNLDRLTAQGMRFTQAYADAQCSPTRAALFSGQYGARSGVFKVIHEKEPPLAFMRPPDANLAMQPNVATLAQTLRAAGYATGMSGKWHIADNYSAAPLRGREQGKYFDKYGFDFVAATGENAHKEDKATAAITDDIIGFIEQNKARSWFAYAAYFAPHTPMNAPRELVDKYAARGFKRTTSPVANASERPSAEYLAMLEHLDTHVGRLLAKLDELKLAENTLVIFTSDNGGLSRMTSNAPLREGKGSPYEGGIRVPLIARWPGKIKAGAVNETPVHTVDYYPTLVSISSAKFSSDHKQDGVSLLPLLTGKGQFKRDALYWHMPTYTVSYARTPCAVVRQGDWKLIHWFGDYLDTAGVTPDDKPYGKLLTGARTELYNLRDDVSEKNDLLQKQPQKAAELKQKLEAWWRDTRAAFPEKNPNYDAQQWWKAEEELRRTNK